MLGLPLALLASKIGLGNVFLRVVVFLRVERVAKLRIEPCHAPFVFHLGFQVQQIRGVNNIVFKDL